MVALNSYSQVTFMVTKQAQLDNLEYIPSSPNVDRGIIITTTPGQDSATMVTNLSVFRKIDTIYGNLSIRVTALTDFSGLDNVVIIGGLYIYDNTNLVDLSSMRGPKVATQVVVSDNPNMIKCAEFSGELELDFIKIERNSQLNILNLKLDSIIPTWQNGVVIIVENNDNLDSIRISDKRARVSNLIFKNNPITNNIHFNTERDSLFGVSLINMPSLEKVSGFDGVSIMSSAWILNNPKLGKLCFIKQTLERRGVGYLKLDSNGVGANTEAEILATDCTDFNTGIAGVLNYEELQLYPNPAYNEVYVGLQEHTTSYTIYDISGKTVNQGFVESSGRISLETISNGMYVLMIGNKRSKLIVQ